MTSLQESTKPVIAEPQKYPDDLEAEYEALITKKLRRTITKEEVVRLLELRGMINAIDSQRTKPDIWDIQAQKIHDDIAQLRADVEALPDAF